MPFSLIGERKQRLVPEGTVFTHRGTGGLVIPDATFRWRQGRVGKTLGDRERITERATLVRTFSLERLRTSCCFLPRERDTVDSASRVHSAIATIPGILRPYPSTTPVSPGAEFFSRKATIVPIETSKLFSALDC
ncbi:hypothetical protein MAP00_007217 [Monascus purpureus]|nr:hypothetical protein MAP00_007217 [Monascus purpureus]